MIDIECRTLNHTQTSIKTLSPKPQTTQAPQKTNDWYGRLAEHASKYVCASAEKSMRIQVSKCFQHQSKDTNPSQKPCQRMNRTENANNLYLISSMKDSWAYITKRWFVSTIKTNVSFWDPFFKQPHQIRYSYVHDACNRPMVSMCKLNFTTIKAQVTISDGVVFNARCKVDVGAWISFSNKTESISK